MRFRALVEEWDTETLVFIRELPGCFATAPTGEAAVHAAHNAVSQHLFWLMRKRLPMPCDPRDPIRISVEEWLLASGDAEPIGPLFKADCAALTPDALLTGLQIADAARGDLLKCYAQTPARLHTITLPPDTMTLEDHLAHVAQMELWYVAALNDGRMPTARLSNSPADALRSSGDYAAGRLRALSPELLGQIFERDGESWTAAKVLRRMTAHLREHLPLVERIANQAGV